MQFESDPTVTIVLAAGCGQRFAASGGRVHKLQVLLAGKAGLEHVLDAVRSSNDAGKRLAKLARRFAFGAACHLARNG